MKILVTGGAGYIGSILVPRLLKDKHSIIVLDNFLYNQFPLLEHCHNKDLEIVRGDVRDETLIKKLLKNTDLIIPLAAIVGAPACDRDTTMAETVNLESIAMLDKLRSKNQSIIFPTTNSGYGIGQEGIFCTEETPLKPITLYGRLKVDAEKILLGSGNAITLRLATIFGLSPRMRMDLLVNDFVWRALRDRFIVLFESHFKRNYIHIRDVAEAFVFSLKNFKEMKDEAYNVGLSDANLSKLELCEKIKEHLPDFTILTSEIGKDPDKRNYIVSNEKIEKKGFKPRFSLDEGIEELIKGYTVLGSNSRFANI